VFERRSFLVNKLMKVLIFVMVITVGLGVLTGCGKKNPVVTLFIKDKGYIKIELYPDKAPNTVRNFIYLVQEGFYDGLTFHRIVPNFVIQGGDPNGDGSGGPGYFIKGEFPNNGFKKNNLKHTRGMVSMARGGDPLYDYAFYDTAGSQFFIVLEDRPALDGNYAVFGKVIEGMDIVDAIADVKTDSKERPIEPQIIEKATVELFGVEYEEPEKIQ